MKYIWSWIERIIQFFIESVLHMKVPEERMNGLLQFVKFGAVGLSNTVISYIIYVIALLIFQMMEILENVDYLIAQIIAFILSVLWSFYWNNKYVFSSSSDKGRNIFKTLIKTYISYAFTGLFLNSVLAVLWIQVLRISKMTAPIINILISVPINFIMNKFWTFKQ